MKIEGGYMRSTGSIWFHNRNWMMNIRRMERQGKYSKTIHKEGTNHNQCYLKDYCL